MPLDRHVQGLHHPLGGIEIQDDPVDADRLFRHAKGFRIEAIVDNHFFGRAGNAEEVGVHGRRPRIVGDDLRMLGDLGERSALGLRPQLSERETDTDRAECEQQAA